jgi:N-glycosylase/DNA lyase
MDELFDIDQKQDIKDLVEWVAEIPTEYKAASGLATLGIGASLVTKNGKYAIGGCGLGSCLVLYKLMQNSETDKELKESYKALEESQLEVKDASQQLLKIIKEHSEAQRRNHEEMREALDKQSKLLENMSVVVGQQDAKIDTLNGTVSKQNKTLGQMQQDIKDCAAQSQELVKRTINLQGITSESIDALKSLKTETVELSTDMAAIYVDSTASILKELSKTLRGNQSENMPLKNGN